MKKIINNISALLFLGFATIPSAQGQSLSDFINTALANNYQIRILKNNEAIAENNDSWGAAGMAPSVNLSGGISTAFNTTRQEFSSGTFQEGKNAQTSNMNLSLLANWTAFDGFGVYARKDQFEYLHQQGQLSTKFYIDQTISDIATAYYQLIYEQGLLKNYQGSLTISRYRLKLEERRKSVGSGTLMSYNQALVDYQTDSIRFLEQENRIHTFEIEIKRILTTDLDAELDYNEANFSFKILPPRDSIFSGISNNSFALKSAELNELIAETQVRIEKANRYPTIDLYGGYQIAQSNAEVGFISLNRNLGPVIGLNVNFNLYNGGNVTRAIENAEITSESANLNREDITNNLRAQALTLYDQYQSLLQRIAIAQNNVSAMEEVYEAASNQLSKGAITGYEFRLVQLSLINTQSTLLSQEFALKLAEIGLNRITGKALEVYL